MANGVILTSSTDVVCPLHVDTQIQWDISDHIGDRTFHVLTSKGKITVPAGVDYLEIFFNAFSSSGGTSTMDPSYKMFLNSAILIEMIITDCIYASGSIRSGPIAVSEGDYFEAVAYPKSSGNPVLDKNLLAFGAVTMERSGFVEAELSTGVVFSGANTDISWNSAPIDTLSSWNGTTGFVVPGGVSYAVVSFNTIGQTFDTTDPDHRLKINGVTVRKYIEARSHWVPGPPTFGIVAVSPGDVITIGVNGGTNAIKADMGIEWISGS